MSHIFAHRLKGIPAPATIEMARCTRALKAKGCDVISLALGEPMKSGLRVLVKRVIRPLRESLF